MSVNPFRPVQLGASVALSTVLSGGVSTLPPGNFSDVARALVGFCGVALSTKVVCETLVDDANAEATAQESEVQAALTRDLYRANHAYYREFPHHWKARQPVPDQWLELWGQTGGKPYLALHPSSPQAFAPVAPIAQSQTQTQTQTVTVREPGVTRGGSFGIDDDFAPVHPPAPIAPTLTNYSPPAQSSIAQPDEWEPDAIDLHAPDESWIDSLLRPSVLLVYGSDGSGKTSMARELLARRQAANHQTFALDPHSHPGKWGTCEVIGAGMGHKAIAAFIARLQGIITDRYERISKGEVRPGAFQPISIVCEELTDWSGEVSNSDLLLAKAGHYRKANVHLILVSHGDKLGQLGSPKGFADMANRILTKLKLESKPGHDGEPIPAFKGLLTQPNCQPVPVVVPRFGQHQPETPQPNPETTTAQTISPDIADRFGFHETPETPPKRPEMMALPPAETRNTDEPPKGAECRDLFFRLKDLGLNQTQIIKAIWGATPGDSPQYKTARDFYQLLNSEYSQNTGESAA